VSGPRAQDRVVAIIRRQMWLDPFPLLVAEPKTDSCSQFQILPANESLSYCLCKRINEFDPSSMGFGG
jgi:hypothetical protein